MLVYKKVEESHDLCCIIYLLHHFFPILHSFPCFFFLSLPLLLFLRLFPLPLLLLLVILFLLVSFSFSSSSVFFFFLFAFSFLFSFLSIFPLFYLFLRRVVVLNYHLLHLYFSLFFFSCFFSFLTFTISFFVLLFSYFSFFVFSYFLFLFLLLLFTIIFCIFYTSINVILPTSISCTLSYNFSLLHIIFSRSSLLFFSVSLPFLDTRLMGSAKWGPRRE